MAWEFNNDRPIYLQIEEKIKLMIISGMYEKGAKVEPVRDLSAEAGVNPNTMQRALAELEREGFMTASRTSGRYVTENEELIRAEKQKFAENKLSFFLSDMKRMGYSKEEVISLLKNYDMGV